jgi:hypothetical protein
VTPTSDQSIIPRVRLPPVLETFPSVTGGNYFRGAAGSERQVKPGHDGGGRWVTLFETRNGKNGPVGHPLNKRCYMI